jgi:hypothetical protein
MFKVFALGSGLAQTGIGAATGLADSAKAPFAGSENVPQANPAQAADEEAPTKKGPRKIEIRDGQPVDVSGQDGEKE